MVMAWAGLATVAIFMARYMKLVWPDEKLSGKPLWFAVGSASCPPLRELHLFVFVFSHVSQSSKLGRKNNFRTSRLEMMLE